MKKLMLTFVVLLTVSFAFASNGMKKNPIIKSLSVSKVISTSEINSTPNTVLEIETLADSDVACRWRTCTYINGERQGCTEWTYGRCNKDGNGKLTKIE